MKNLLSAWLKKKDDPSPSPQRTLMNILKTMREGVIIVGEDMRILASNQSAYEAFGRGNGALDDKRLSEVIRDLSVHEAFGRALGGAPPTELKLELLGAERRSFLVRVAPLDFEGTPSAVGIFYEQTQIERLERMRQEFLSNVSHELRTPLTSILAFVETLEDGALDDAQNNRRFLSVIRRNAERMHHLIDDVLELSSIEAGKISIDAKPLRLSALVDEVFMNLSGKAGDKNVRLENLVAPDAFVFADVNRLEQMLTNLADNAVKFSGAGGAVTISHERSPDGRDLIRVADEGDGIAPEHQQRIFERFYRADRARSREVGGTGLGLSIVKHLARLHGGEISVASAPGKGSVFTLELPARPALAASRKNLS